MVERSYGLREEIGSTPVFSLSPEAYMESMNAERATYHRGTSPIQQQQVFYDMKYHMNILRSNSNFQQCCRQSRRDEIRAVRAEQSRAVTE